MPSHVQHTYSTHFNELLKEVGRHCLVYLNMLVDRFMFKPVYSSEILQCNLKHSNCGVFKSNNSFSELSKTYRSFRLEKIAIKHMHKQEDCFL